MKLNNEINIVTQEIKIDNLPKEFEGFTILQLTDLHSKTFGKEQERLTSLINNQKFDIIAITGDMQNRQQFGYKAFIKLLKGIEDKSQIYYTPGNHGPYPFVGQKSFSSFYKRNKVFLDTNSSALMSSCKLTDVGLEMTELGVKFLNRAHTINKNGKKLWITELLYKDEFRKITNNETKDKDLLIAITHYPMSKKIFEGKQGKKMPAYDLILAGHYHGGQWRIPGVGGFFIPDLNESGWFPSQDRVSGLTEWGGFKQYVSRGLGAGGPIKFLRFRMFNKPEINLIKLVSK